LHNHVFLNEAKIDVNLGYVFNNRREFEGEHEHEDEDHDHGEEEPGYEAALDMDLSTFTYEGKYYFPKKNKLEVIAGMQGLIQNNKNSGEEILIPDASTKDIGFFASGIYELNKNNIFQVGTRFDHRNLETEAYTIKHHDHDGEDHDEEEVEIVEAIDKNYENFTFSLGYRTQLFNTITTRINLASGFRAPNLAELTSYGVHHGTNRFEIGDPDLESEQNFQADLSMEYGNEHFEIFTNGFYNRINDYIFLSPTGESEDDASVFIYEQSDAYLFGGEFGFHLHPHPLDWLHLESSFSSVTGKQADDKYLPLIPANKWTNIVRAEFNGINFLNDYYFSLEVDSFFAQNKVSDFETPSEGYNLLGLSLGGNMKLNKIGLRANLSINNLLDESYVSHLSALKVDQIPNPGRNIVLGLGFVF
jgi:iron complex outermembrane receptor protein